jgi:hypothetical protein
VAKGSLLRALAAEYGKPTAAHLWGGQEELAQRRLDALRHYFLASAPGPASRCRVSFVSDTS